MTDHGVTQPQTPDRLSREPSAAGEPAGGRPVQLARLTSIRVGGWAPRYHEPRDLQELRELLEELGGRGESPFILGGGANTLFPDGEFARPVVSTRRLNRWRVDGHRVQTECGVLLSRLIQVIASQGLSGLEGFIGIPGTAGGAVCMNAGGRGWSFGDRVEEIGLMPRNGGPILRRPGSEIAWGYRNAGLADWVVAWVTLRLDPDSREAVRSRMREMLEEKLRAQPLGERSAGCVFRNPPGVAAGRLIDQLGLKGLCRGGARVSERHANFIVNASGRASAGDVTSLVEEIRARVASSFGVRLETEIVLA